MSRIEVETVSTAPAVLLADAACDEREMYAAALSQQGFDIRQAATGAEALQDIRTHRPDVVVADVCLPVMGGLDLLRCIRREADTRDIPVILLSGYAGMMGELSQAAALGVDAIRIKPLSPESLASDIAEVILKSGRLRSASIEMRMRSAELRQRVHRVMERSRRTLGKAERALTRSATIRKRQKP